MVMKHRKRGDPLAALVQEADAKMLRELVQKLAANRPEIRRECFVFLKQRVSLDSAMKTETEAEIAFSLWNELEPDLAELDEYGGGPDETEESVGELLYELSQRLKEGEVPRDERRALIDEVIPYIRSGNAGMDDALYEVAYAACADEEDWRYLAHQLEALGRDWPVDHARRIYRRIGDRAKYLALRAHRMEYGADYHDLATFFGKLENGNRRWKWRGKVWNRPPGGWMNYAVSSRSGHASQATGRDTCNCSLRKRPTGSRRRAT